MSAPARTVAVDPSVMGQHPARLASDRPDASPSAPPERTRVAILLSTYNGAAYLPAQLRSFQDQTHRDWVLYWRDDGSADATVAQLDAFAAAEPRCRRLQGPPGHLGATASFLTLLRDALPLLADGMVAFADQDDVWLPDKLARGVAGLAGDPGPALYCARQTLVDAGLRRLGASPALGSEHRFPAALARNVAVGCTVLLNRPAARLVAASTAPPGAFHDWWCYVLVTAAGGACHCDPAEVILYRQHGSNAVGAAAAAPRRALAAGRRGPGAFMDQLRAMLDALAAQPEALTGTARADVERLRNALTTGMLARARVLWALRARLRRTNLAETVLFRLWFLIG